MTITATVVADSVSPAGIRLTTLQLRYPRFVHAEFMTHRVFSRNASSSRAIPVERLIEDVLRDPAMPSFWGKNQPGMQAREEHIAPVIWERAETYNSGVSEDGSEMLEGSFDPMSREEAWTFAMLDAVDGAKALAKAGYHKQIVNRLLEPFSHINVVVSATEWENFFALRCHPDAQPEMRLLAEAMRDARAASAPVPLYPGQWHLPYTGPQDRLWADNGSVSPHDWRWTQIMRAISAARCARVSYLTHDGKQPSVEADLALYDRLAAAVPMHTSPLEHQATPDEWGVGTYGDGRWDHGDQHGNFTGWRQHRKMIEQGVK
jgi:thymidylate synthase ThyX